MNITRTARIENGKLVWDRPYTLEEKRENEQRFLDMTRSKIAPGTGGTDRAFLQGHVLNHNLQDMPVWMQQNYVTRARKAGINITGKVYKSGLADKRGPADPRAWVSDLNDVRHVCEDRSLYCEGSFHHTPEQPPPTPDCPLADSAIAECAMDYLAEDPSWALKPQELKEMIVEKHGAPAAYKTPIKFSDVPLEAAADVKPAGAKPPKRKR